MKESIKVLFSLLLSILSTIILISCQPKGSNNQTESEIKTDTMKHVEWSINANIYEVNIRQYTTEGTFNAFRTHIPRLKEMGVDILWLMPIFPVGELNRKGSLGSYYAVRDYKAVNPEFGTMDDFKALVNEAHANGMHVILDWVANHSSWDNVWVSLHPEYYKKTDDGQFVSPYDWTDVIAFDYSNPAMRDSMTRALEFWIRETNIDGYRCDVAGLVPTDYWNDAVAKLKEIKPVFMLAENEDDLPLYDTAFDMNYSWKLFKLMHSIAKGEKKANETWNYLAGNDSLFASDLYRMNFTANHDENSWNGTTRELFGDGQETFAVLTYVLPGMPLIYSGQEAGLDKRLRFFEKDTIDWTNLPLAGFYRTLNNLKFKNKALWNGDAGGQIINAINGQNENVFAAYREKNGHKILVLLNLSPENQKITIENDRFTGIYTDVFANSEIQVANFQQFELIPWKYIVLTAYSAD